MDARKGGHKYCPSCKQIVETRVLLEGYCQVMFDVIPAKKHHIICGTDAEDSKGCGTKWLCWNYRKINYYHQLKREAEILKGDS